VEVQLHVRVVDGVPVLDVAGELDIYTSPKLKSAMADLLGEGHARFVVNLMKTTYLDSTALSVLTAALKQSRSSGGNVGLIFTQPQIDKIFTITGLHEVFPIFRTEQDAVRAAQSWAQSAPQS
jgi:anti-sigma B factor antagonist